MSEEILIRLEEERKELNEYNKKIFIISGSLLGLSMLIIFGGFLASIQTISLVGVGLFLVSIICFLVLNANPKFNERKRQMKIDLVEWYLADKGYENFTYDPKDGLSYKDFYELGLIRTKPDKVDFEDLINGEYKNVKFSMSDLTLERKDTYRDSNGKRRTRYVTFFKGKVIEIDYPRDLDCDAILLDRDDTFFGGNDGEKLETEVIEFNQTFHIYTSDKGTVFKILSPHMITKILEFKERQRGKVSLAFTRDKLYIVVNNNSDMANIKLGKEITKEVLENYLGDFLLPAEIINSFRIDTSKFQN